MGCSLLFATSACNDFLDEEVQGQLSDVQFYQNEADASQAVSAIYDMLMQDNPGGAWTSLWMTKVLPSDEAYAGGGSTTDQQQYQDLDDFNYDEANTAVIGAWRNLYATIYRANQVINNINPEESELMRRFVAEAKTLRAYSYMELVSLWGPVPIVPGLVGASEYGEYPRMSEEEVYQLIEADLTDAIAALPVKSNYATTEQWRVSKGTAQALLGKAHLYQQEYSAALTQLEAVIGSGEYGLEPSVAEAFSVENEFGQESVFEVSYTTRENYTQGNFPWGNNESFIHIQLSGPRGDNYRPAPNDSLIGGWGFMNPTEKLYDAVVETEEGSDAMERYWSTLMTVEDLQALGGDWVGQAHDFEGIIRRKYGTFVTEAAGSTEQVNYGTNLRVIRYADVLLMAAEAHLLAPDGNPALALEYINRVRERSELVPLTAVAIEDIVRERFVELAFEGHRFQDLLRWDMAGLVSIEDALGSFGFRPRFMHFPIPVEDVQIAGLEQNPGYGQ